MAARYEIEVAEVPGQFRAEALARKLEVKYTSGSFWSTPQKARVVAKEDGGESTLYAVRYGDYANKEATTAMCEQLSADGLACSVVERK